MFTIEHPNHCGASKIQPVHEMKSHTQPVENCSYEKLKSRLDGEISSFNSLSEKHGHKEKLKWLHEQEMVCGRLVLGTEHQFMYHNYQAILAYGVKEALAVAEGLRIYICAEFGE